LKKDGKKKLVTVLDGTAAAVPPVWMMRQAGRFLPEYRAVRVKAGSFWTMCMDPEMAAEVTLQPVRRFGMDAAILFSDILVIPYALGGEVRFEENVGPLLTRYADIAKVERDPAVWAEKLAPVYETLKRVAAALEPETALLGFAGAPWTLATYLAEGRGSPDQRAAKLWGYREPESFAKLLDLLADCVAAHLVRQLEAGADAVQIFDSWASGVTEQGFADWVIRPTKRIVSAVRAAVPGARIIGFPRATTQSGYERYAAETGVNAVSIDTATPMGWAAKTLGPKLAVQGNLDPLLLLAGGEALDRGVDAILEATRGVPHIFNLGHGVVPETPPEHVGRVLARIRGQKIRGQA
jgi:uroporphyrinogen decarboxylase